MRNTIPSDFSSYIEQKYFCEHQSVRMIAAHYEVDHSTVSRWMSQIGKPPISRSDSAKYTWKNHVNPNTGRKGPLSYMYGRHQAPESIAKTVSKISGPNNYHWSGGRKKHSEGYILIYRPGSPNANKHGFAMEHRIVAEEMIGRPLKRDEVVHHINEVKTDNRPENLLVLSRGEHILLHKRLDEEREKHA